MITRQAPRGEPPSTTRSGILEARRTPLSRSAHRQQSHLQQRAARRACRLGISESEIPPNFFHQMPTCRRIGSLKPCIGRITAPIAPSCRCRGLDLLAFVSQVRSTCAPEPRKRAHNARCPSAALLDLIGPMPMSRPDSPFVIVLSVRTSFPAWRSAPAVNRAKPSRWLPVWLPVSPAERRGHRALVGPRCRCSLASYPPRSRVFDTSRVLADVIAVKSKHFLSVCHSTRHPQR